MKLTVALSYKPTSEQLRVLETLARENARAAEPLEIEAVTAVKLPLDCEHFRVTTLELDEKESGLSRLKASLAGMKGFRADYIKALKTHLAADKPDALAVLDCVELAEPLSTSLKLNPTYIMREIPLGEEHMCARDAYRTVKRFVLQSAALVKKGEGEYLPQKRCTVLRDAVDSSEFDPEKRAEAGRKLRERLGIGDESVIIVTDTPDVSSGAAELCKAVASCVRPDSKIIICGEPDEDYRNQLVNAASERNLILAGEIGADELPDYLAAADIAAIPTLSSTGTLAAVEAMAMGLELLTSDSAALDEYTRDYPATVRVRRGLGYVSALEEGLNELHGRSSDDEKAARAVKSSTSDWYQALLAVINAK